MFARQSYSLPSDFMLLYCRLRPLPYSSPYNSSSSADLTHHAHSNNKGVGRAFLLRRVHEFPMEASERHEAFYTSQRRSAHTRLRTRTSDVSSYLVEEILSASDTSSAQAFRDLRKRRIRAWILRHQDHKTSYALCC